MPVSRAKSDFDHRDLIDFSDKFSMTRKAASAAAVSRFHCYGGASPHKPNCNERFQKKTKDKKIWLTDFGGGWQREAAEDRRA